MILCIFGTFKEIGAQGHICSRDGGRPQSRRCGSQTDFIELKNKQKKSCIQGTQSWLVCAIKIFQQNIPQIVSRFSKIL